MSVKEKNSWDPENRAKERWWNSKSCWSPKQSCQGATNKVRKRG